MKVPGILKSLVEKASSISTEGGTVVRVWKEADAVVSPPMVTEQLGMLIPAMDTSVGNTMVKMLPLAMEALGVIAKE